MRFHRNHNYLWYILIILALCAGIFYANPVRSVEVENKIAHIVWHVDFAEPRRF